MTKPFRRRLRPDWQNELSLDAVEFLRGDNDAFPYMEGITLTDAAELYRSHADEMIAEHVVESPGTRPRLWWRHCAPEMRRRLGGRGNSNATHGFGEPTFGIPTTWFFPDDPIFRDDMFGHAWNEIRGCLTAKVLGELEPVDPFDPPRFESQAAFLKRHRLFVRREAARLTAADFAPEVIRRPRR